MAVIYRCKACKYELYRFNGEGFHGPPTPSEIRAIYNGRCPNCGRELGNPGIDDVIIDVIDVVSFKIPRRYNQKLEEIAKKRGVTKSDIIREAIIRYLENIEQNKS